MKSKKKLPVGMDNFTKLRSEPFHPSQTFWKKPEHEYVKGFLPDRMR